MLKDIDLTNKCGSCDHFKPIEDTATGECLQYPYDDSVVHDPKHPHWIVQRSRIKCRLYNAKPQTNADRIRAMTDEQLAAFVYSATHINDRSFGLSGIPCCSHNRTLQWLKQPAEHLALENDCIYGYRAEELALVAELLHRNLVSEDDLHRLFDSFSMMYKIIIEQHQLEIKNAANSVLVQSTYPSPAEVAMMMFPDIEVKEPEAKAITLRPWNDLRKESVKE